MGTSAGVWENTILHGANIIVEYRSASKTILRCRVVFLGYNGITGVHVLYTVTCCTYESKYGRFGTRANGGSKLPWLPRGHAIELEFVLTTYCQCVIANIRKIFFDRKAMDFGENLTGRQNSTEYFDTVIGHIEDIVIGEEFQVCGHVNCIFVFISI